MGYSSMSRVTRRTIWELNEGEGLRWLEARAEAGDCFAAEKLGELLIDNGTKAEEGIAWLREAIDAGSSHAMYSLGIRALDREIPSMSPVDGYALLERAATKVSLAAMTELGIRLIFGWTLPPDIDKGHRWLREAAERGDGVALIRFSRLLDRSIHITASLKERKRWAVRAGLTGEAGMRVQALLLYSEGLCAPTRRMRGLLLSEAGVLLRDARENGDMIAAATLAHLIRRGEVPSSEALPMEDLLSDGVSRGMPFACVNFALVLALGFECSPNWERADHIFGGLRTTFGILEWWSALSQDGDPEGDLVIGWLCRHGLASDPNDWSLERRLTRVEENLCSLPNWFKERCYGGDR